MITHEQAGDTFWDKIRAGAQDAAKAHGIDLKYSNNENGPEQATLVQNAIDSKVDGHRGDAVQRGRGDPGGEEGRRRRGSRWWRSTRASTEYKEAGAKMYFGSDETLAGQTVGEKITQADGGGKTLCIIQAQGSVALETRCKGVKQGYAEHGEPAGQRRGPALGAADDPVEAGPGPVDHPHRDPGRADRAGRVRPRRGAGNTAKMATFDLNQDAAQAIKDGKIEFSVDQQPYVQGYMAVMMLWMNITNGNDLGGGKPVLTGPSIVDQTNIDQILPYTANNRR